MRLAIMFVAVACLALAAAPSIAEPPSDTSIHVDIPVALKEAKVVFNLDHAAFDGDEPIGLNFLRLMVERFRSANTNAHIVAIFHGPAGYMALDDAEYNRVRHWAGGNPYKEQIAALLRDGVEIEECGQTMVVNQWPNSALLKGVKVNSGANFRIVQLVQEGFVQLQP
jgi:intracellular sulfur oxidation DsrE/DsrF family protein